MAIAPTSDIYLLDVPLDITQKNQLTFATANDQLAYFQSKIMHTYQNVTYIRKPEISNKRFLAIPEAIDALYNSNYVMYQNDGYGGRWFYAFIEDMEYVNDGLTRVYIKTDVFQTWYFSATFKESFVEREHVTNDAKFANLLPESFEYGELVQYGQKNLIDLNNMVIVVVYIDIVTDSDVVSGTMKGNVFTGLNYVFYQTSEIEALNELLNGFAEAGKLDNVVNIFMMPFDFIGSSSSTSTFDGILPSSLDGYTPKNNKLFNYPFTCLTGTNCNGQTATYKFEYFDNPNLFYFGLYHAYNDKPSCSFVPLYYKGNPANWDEGLTIDNFPVCAWVGDVYKNWYAQNEIIIEQQKLGNFIGMAGSVGGGAIAGGLVGGPPGALVGAIAGGVSSLSATMGLLAQVEQKKLFPEQLRGRADGQRFNAAQNRIGFELSRRTIKAEYARIIDDFFEMYGYKVCNVKVPNLRTRTYWNFVKTIDINITGPIPSKDMEELKSMFNNGITLWHNPTYFCDYSQNNH